MRADVLGRIAAHPSSLAAKSHIGSGKRVALYDMTPGLRLLYALSLSRERQVLYLLPSERSARQAAEDAKQAGAEGVSFLPQKELRFLRAVSSREDDWQRVKALWQALSGEARTLVCSVEALQAYLPPPEWMRASSRVFHRGDVLQPQDAALFLTAAGYERVELVEGRGQFALRGDILDVFPPQADLPARVEFFDVEVDSIRSFDPLTQRSVGQLETLSVIPALEHLLPEGARGAAAERVMAAVASPPLEAKDGRGLRGTAVQAEEAPAPDVERLRADGRFDEMHMWAHLLYPEGSSLLSYLPGAAVVLDTPDRAAQRLKENGEGYAGMLAQALESGLAFPAQAGLLRQAEEALALLEGRGVALAQELLRGMAGLEPEAAFSFQSRRPDSYRGRLRELADDLRAWQEAGTAVYLFSGGQARGERLTAALAAQGLSVPAEAPDGAAGKAGPLLLWDGLAEGLLLPGAGLVLLSPQDLFGSARQKARKAQTAGQRIEAFTDLSEGDYVVHEHHGIGVYQGTVRLQSEGVWRDYLFIRYQGSDKLYVPADQFDRVQKYIGSPDAPPALNDLSSNAWSRQKSRVKAGLKQLAFDLVKLYAGRQANPGFAFESAEPFEGQFADQFEYELTPDQEQAVGEVLSDMAKPRNMDRLLCGDVGYGKTEVAMRAAFRAVMNGKQVALLAPTTILVQQHVRTLQKRFEGFPVMIEYVSRFRTPRENRLTLQKAKEGRVDILIGTHRLLSRDVAFHNLGLLVIDEEQRFGVRHKELIKNYKSTVDVLTLSATPIPRTLHMSMVGVRDMSLLETPPEERFPVATYVADYQEALVRDAVMRELAREGQVFFLYNRVADIERMASALRRLVPEARLAVAHGQMPEQALEDVMLDFYERRVDLLLCSTIIENGLDIQNANTLIVYDADRFGLSQLYQLRGRVGRANRAAYAFFTVQPDRMLSESAEKRLSAIREFTAFGAGFRIAMRDLEIRGAGNIFGPEQSGQVATVGYDMYVKMIEEAIREAQGDFSSLRDSELETRADLKVNAYLPETYVRGEAQRIEVYKRIAMLRTREEEEELVADLIDRFGEPEEPVMNLISIARLRALANSLGADQARQERGAVVLRFDPRYAVDPARLYKAMLTADRRISLSAGKKTSLVLKLPGLEPRDALREAVRLLQALKDALDRTPGEPEAATSASSS